jgi:hypothetical protein
MGNEWSIKQDDFRIILIFSSLRAASLPIAIKSSVKQGMISVTSNCFQGNYLHICEYRIYENKSLIG